MIAAFLPILGDGGHTLNITSAVTRFYQQDHGLYSAIKDATEVISLYMATEPGERRIAVNAIAPGAITSDFGGRQVHNNAEINQSLLEITPLEYVGKPDDRSNGRPDSMTISYQKQSRAR